MTPTPVSQEARESADALAGWLADLTDGQVKAVATDDTFEFRQAFARFESTIRKQERDQCAKVAEDNARVVRRGVVGFADQAWNDAGRTIATAIRKGSEA